MYDNPLTGRSTNPRIQWHPGMEMTTAVFRNLEDDLSQRQRITVRAAISDGRIGVLPDTELHVEGGFVKRTLEMNGLRITALTPSGMILYVDDDLRIEIPKLQGTDYYLCVEMSHTETRTYERDGILYDAPKYELALYETTDHDALSGDCIPLEHLQIIDGVLSIDNNYIIPMLSLRGDSRFGECRDRLAKALDAIANHENMDEGDCKRTLLSLLFRLRTFSMERPVRDFIDLLQEISMSIRYYVVDGLGSTLDSTDAPAKKGSGTPANSGDSSPDSQEKKEEKPDDKPEEKKEGCPEKPVALQNDSRSMFTQYDIAAFLRWIEEYLVAQQEIMERVVIVDNSIDYEKLKAELRDEIYGKLYDELYNRLKPEIHDALDTEITESVMNAVKELVNEHLHPELYQQLMGELHDPLYNNLYEALYNALYDALYKPIEAAKDEFMPLI